VPTSFSRSKKNGGHGASGLCATLRTYQREENNTAVAGSTSINTHEMMITDDC